MSSVSDFVATTMDSVLNSKEHQSLFNTVYKTASSEECEKTEDSCEDMSYAEDDLYVSDSSCSSDSCSSDSNSVSDGSVSDKVSSAYNIAVDSLLTASAALDSLGLEKGAELSLKLASLVVEAKKAKVKPGEKKEVSKKDKGSKPVKPAKPVKPVKPVKPAKPAKPAKSSKEKSVVSDKSVKKDKGNKVSKPAMSKK